MAETSDQRNVLVTGATGFLGTHLVKALSASGYHVFSLSRKAATESPQSETSSTTSDATSAQPQYIAEHYQCDLTSTDVEQVLGRVLTERPWYAVIHLAGLISYNSRKDDAMMQKLNVDATEKLVASLVRCSPETKLVYCSSVVSVGSNAHKGDALIDEDREWDDSLNHIGYVRTKRAGEDIVRQVGKEGKLSCTCICPSNIYGPGDGVKSSRKTQIRAANGKQRMYTNGGVSIVHVSVIVDLLLKMLVDEDEELWKGTRWLVTGDNITVHQMLCLFSEKGGNARNAPWLNLPNWLLFVLCYLGELLLKSSSLTMDRFQLATRYHWYDGSRARQRFDLPSIPADIAIAESVKWMQDHGIVK